MFRAWLVRSWAGARVRHHTPGPRSPVRAAFTPTASARDGVQLARCLVEHVCPALAANDDVLDPRAVSAGQVDARLDAERVPELKRLLVAGDEIRLLVALE